MGVEERFELAAIRSASDGAGPSIIRSLGGCSYGFCSLGGCSYDGNPLPILAEMREQPGGSGVNMATFPTVQPDSSRCSATIALARRFWAGDCSPEPLTEPARICLRRLRMWESNSLST
jgi:hypothetical protein